jgi:hypothetical protein
MMESGWVKVSSTDVLDLHYKYQQEKAGAVLRSATAYSADGAD